MASTVTHVPSGRAMDANPGCGILSSWSASRADLPLFAGDFVTKRTRQVTGKVARVAPSVDRNVKRESKTTDDQGVGRGVPRPAGNASSYLRS